MRFPKVLALVGAQYGSEGKGVIAYNLRDKYGVHVRTGAPQAGHSFKHEGVKFVQRSVPCGWINPDNKVVIGRGALIHLPTLAEEVRTMVAMFGEKTLNRLYIDHKAGILEDHHHDEEGGVGGQLHQLIGSTGEGVGAARRARMARGVEPFRTFADASRDHDILRELGGGCDSVEILYKLRQDNRVMLEGTQGLGLSLIHGSWPHVTSHDTTPATMAADCGIPTTDLRTLLVARTFPIRVAGASGPLAGEISWEEMSKRVGKPITELTTVTKKTRRIGMWDHGLYRRAAILTDPIGVAITFMDYLHPKTEGAKTMGELTPDAMTFLDAFERCYKHKVLLVGTGGPDWSVVLTSRSSVWF